MRARAIVVSTVALTSSCHGAPPPAEVVVPSPPAATTPAPEPPRGALAPRDVGRTRSVALAPEGDWGEDRCGVPTGVHYRIGPPEHADAPTGAPPATTGVTTDCRTTFDAHHDTTAVPVGVEPFVVRVSDVAVTHRDVTLFTARDACQALEGGTVCQTDEESVWWSLMSLVGPVITIRASHSSAGGGGPYYHHEAWWTIDLRTGEPAAFDALVTLESLRGGLGRSADLREALDDEALARIDAARSLDEAFSAAKIIGERKQGSLGFAFARGAADQPTTVRIGHRESTWGMSPNQLETVDVRVDPRPEARAWFEAARRGLGVLAGPEED